MRKTVMTFFLLQMLFTTSVFCNKHLDGYYLFVYFTGNQASKQRICYALSSDGIDFVPLNGGHPVIASDSIAVMKGVRDPHILRGTNGWFYMVATDMDWTKGKWSNRGIVMMRSQNLLDWEHHTVDFHQRFAGTEAAKVNAVWAPQTIWDPAAQKYMIYFSLHSEKDGLYPQDAIYYTYANADFSDVEIIPKRLFEYPYPTIDADIVLDEAGIYHLFFNTWGGADGLLRRQYMFTDLHDQDKWRLVEGRMQPNDIASEGSCAYPLAGGEWILVYDCFRDGFSQFCRSKDLIQFELVRTTSMDKGAFSPRHGTVIQITEKEFEILKKRYK